MTISIWRYSHLALAVSSFLFIALAAATGIILAFEPVSQKIQPYRTADFSTITVAETLPALKNSHKEIIDLTVDANQFVLVKAIDEDGNDVTVYADPKTGKTLGKPADKNAFFQWVTNLHRSLFLHETGRILIGITSFLLLLIAISGTVLIIQRQRGVKRFFTKIVKENFAQYYHVVLGRLSLIPILILAATGTYLSLVKFEFFPEQKISHQIDFDNIKSEPVQQLQDFSVFKNILLSEVTQIEFPFSDDPEDFFTLKLKDRELTVNQFTGDILSEVVYSKTKVLNDLSLDLHTGRASAIWALVLAVAAANILFFIYSGFVMTWKRRAGRIRNKFAVSESEIIILVGSENGSTFAFAKALQQQLIAAGKKSFTAELNKYQTFAKAEHLIIITATYGLGNPPTNASKFIKLLDKNPQLQPVNFSVIGFGSHAYPDFCKFAYETYNALSLQHWALPYLEIHTVNDKNPEEFQQWASLWAEKSGIQMSDLRGFSDQTNKKLVPLTVIEKTDIAHTDGAFSIRLKFNRKQKFTSGDLLAIYPTNDHKERLYSVGKIGSEIQLSVKLHADGIGSGHLYQLLPGDELQARIVRNPHFHYPKKAKTVIMISNGTGIAPFLGMISENNRKANIHLYCGFRGASSFELYKNDLYKNLSEQKLTQLNVAYSREGAKQYVKDILSRDSILIAETLKNGGVIMICGSLAMQQNAIELLEEISVVNHNKSISYYQSHNQILMDCY